jgi:hypothetical protein
LLGGTVAAISSTDAVAAVVAILIAGAVMLGSMYGFVLPQLELEKAFFR